MPIPSELVTVSPGHRLAVRRAGHGGVPLLLVHGFPCTSLIWSRNIEPLAEAGFDVVAADLRGYGESDFAPDGCYDPAAFSADLTGLLDAFGWRETVVAGHDLGAVVAIDLANRHPQRVSRLVLFNHPPPSLPEDYANAGIPATAPNPAVFGYVTRQGAHAHELVAELDTPDRRHRYIAEFYGHRLWCPPGAFTAADLAELIEPYTNVDRLRASFADYEVVLGRRPASAPDLHDRQVQQPVLVLIGPDDVTLADHLARRCAVAYPHVVGPYLVPDAGHYLQWEQPRMANQTIRWFCGDLLVR
ncbi:MAG TPA: alpha/beta hydrolase [Pseudonocardiaceae bacterium]|nr:alpha/beta hydrolase [Pseudonocardiaceae bacterium]